MKLYAVAERPSPRGVRLVEEDVDAVLPERHVEVAAVPGQARERLRHERCDAAVLLRQRVHHVAEEDGTVAAGERVRVLEVLLELPVRVLVVVRVVAPAELVAVLRHRRQEVVLSRQPGHVVTGLLERVHLVGDLDRPVGVQLHEEVLELAADLELVALLGCLREHVPQDRAGAVRPGFALDGDVAGEAREVLLPGDEREAREIGHRRDVGIARELTDLAGCEAGEPGALLEEAVEVRGGDQLGTRSAVQVDELREDELDTSLPHGGADRLERGRVAAHWASSWSLRGSYHGAIPRVAPFNGAGRRLRCTLSRVPA